MCCVDDTTCVQKRCAYHSSDLIQYILFFHFVEILKYREMKALSTVLYDVILRGRGLNAGTEFSVVDLSRFLPCCTTLCNVEVCTMSIFFLVLILWAK